MSFRFIAIAVLGLVLAGLLPADETTQAAPAMEFIALTRINFESDKSALTPETTKHLDETADYIQLHPDVTRLLLYGHADEVGNDEHNNPLSTKRAQAVRDYLIHKGINPSLLQIAARGRHQPIDENWTQKGRQRNRRVEIFVIRVMPES